MEKLHKSGLYIFIAIVVLFPLYSYAQDAPAPAPAPATPDVVNPPPDFPDYIVTPREDLNNFGLSTMSESEDIDYRDGVGTLGTTEKRQSNLDVNAQLKQRKIEREKAKQKAEEDEKSTSSQSPKAASEPPTLEAVGSGSIKPGIKRGLFMWTDENGVLHATNDLGHVPMEYQMQAIENAGGSMNLKKGDPKKK